MKISFGLISVIIIFVTQICFAAEQKNLFGLGVIISEPTGISLKYWRNSKIAIDGAVGWSVGQRNWLYIHSDYLQHNYKVFETKDFSGKIPVYYGIGIQIEKYNTTTNFGIRIPFGTAYMFKEIPFDIFTEIVPTFVVSPDTNIYLGAAMGIHFYF